MNTSFKNNDLVVVKFHFASKTFLNKTKKDVAMYDLDLYALVSKSNGIIYCTKYHFKHFSINLLTTPSWFEDQNKNNKTNYLRRKLILDHCLLNTVQIKRRSKNQQRVIVSFNDLELSKLNDLVNNNEQFYTTINNLIAIINGSNPSGKIKNNKSSQTVMFDDCNNNSSYYVLVSLIDKLIINKKDLSFFVDDEDFLTFKKLDIDQLNAINILNKYVNKNNDKLTYQAFLEDNLDPILKDQYYSEIFLLLENDTITPALENKIQWSINRLPRLRIAWVEIEKSAKEKRSKVQSCTPALSFDVPKTEKAHIFNVEWIKQEIFRKFIDQWKDKSELEIRDKIRRDKMLDYICDPNNLFGMDPNRHTYFDEYYWIFDEHLSAYLIIKEEKISKEHFNFVKNALDNFKSQVNIISKNLSEETKKYIALRKNKVIQILKKNNKNNQLETNFLKWKLI
ncbi:MAG4270 family putative restriction endonuclease [Ureaplasma diversum]|uniref:HNH nuclease domain-containing protein n=1 Tax=Ureaplasma diversum NCTC 246 TaxID=1188241 RepID=A0A084EXL7_9BACT|nr:HNH endonuclease [Ureaplasma diversum]KEZ22709.1 hypothetical protein UDIV_5160 [Ureaplasma diversum NCTC 246]